LGVSHLPLSLSRAIRFQSLLVVKSPKRISTAIPHAAEKKKIYAFLSTMKALQNEKAIITIKKTQPILH
jgi:hypothetical protein